MKRVLLTGVFNCLLVMAIGQATTARFSGIVLDSASRLPLELATASILHEDSTLLGYQVSDRNGRFVFEKLPLRKRFLLTISYVGYTVFRKDIFLQKADSLSVLMTVNNTDTTGVVVKSVIPVRMNGDTLEINPSAFKMKPNAVVEEMLNEVSGITIWSDGTITVNGKRVQNFFVDGKPFMGSTDPRVATQNLPKTAIDKIQVYQEYDRSKIGQENMPQDSLLSMNVKLKETSKKGYFGKAGVGYGTTGRYEADLSMQVYNKRSSLGVGGGLNNINKNIQNLQEIFQNNTFRSFNPNLYNTGRFGANGINKNYSVGSILAHNFIESNNSRQNNRLTVTYQASGANNQLSSQSIQTRTALANPQVITNDNQQNNSSDRHSLSVDYQKSNSYNRNLGMSGNMDMSTNRGVSSQLALVRDTSGALQSTNRTTSTQNGRSDNESVRLNMANNDADHPLAGFNLQLSGSHNSSVSERMTNAVFTSLLNPSGDTSYNRRYQNSNDSWRLDATLNYTGFKRLILGRYNLFGINMNFTQRFSSSNVSGDSKVSDFDSASKQYVSNNKISNYNRSRVMAYTPSLQLSKSFSKGNSVRYRYFNLQAGMQHDFKSDNNSSSVSNRNLQRNFRFLRYDGNLSFMYQKNNKYSYNSSINMSRSYDYPSVDQLYTIVDDINAYDIRIGNPNLKNRENRVINMYTNFQTINPKSLYAINGNINAGLTRSLNPVVDSVINDPSGKRISYYTNAGESRFRNLSVGLNISRKFKKNNLQLMYSGNMSGNELPNYIDGVYTLSKSNSTSNQFTLQFSLRTIMVITLGKTFTKYKTAQTASGLTNFTNKSETSRIGFTLNYPENVSFSTTYDEIDNSNLNKPTRLWNSFVTYRFMQQQAEFRLSAMDILKQYQNITNSVNSFGTTTTVVNGLQQYFMFTFSYYPRKFGNKSGSGGGVTNITVREF